MVHLDCTLASEEKQQHTTMTPPPAPPQRSMLSALLASQNNPEEKIDEATPVAENDSLMHSSPTYLDDTANSNRKVFNRTAKVAKTEYSDHGAHAVIFDVDEESQTSAHVSSDDNDDHYIADNSSKSLTPQKRFSPGFRAKGKPTSLLHAALTQQSGIAGELAKSAGLEGTSHGNFPTRGECLTNPSDPISNDRSDNIEGNLIVHKNDLFKVPNRKVRHQSVESDSFLNNNDPLGVTTFQVVGLLGQGTFAQVFQCKNLDTGKMCAVKIVKNKPAYTRQATIEIEVFKAMMKTNSIGQRLDVTAEESTEKRNVEDFMVSLLSYFMYKSHLCLVFELLGQNLYELLKQRQFRGLPIRIVKDVVKQAVAGVTELSKRKIVHCDLKPENILLVSEEMSETLANAKFKVGKDEIVTKETGKTIKLIDFGSACFEESAGFTYIQSRFYRSPEVLVGVNYDSAIDMWSLGCVAAELFLGLPILPGVNELDQLGRIQEMIGQVPEWMLDQGKKSAKYYSLNSDARDIGSDTGWNLKTREEFAQSLTKDELERYGGKAKLEQPPANRYFKYTHLNEIVMHHGNCKTLEEKEDMILFVHFLKGLLNPDPCERWTAYQASAHPFLTGKAGRRLKKPEGGLKSEHDVIWSPPWDPSICRRKLSCKQGALSRSHRLRKSTTRIRTEPQDNRPTSLSSPTTLRMANLTGAMSLSNLEKQRKAQQTKQSSPPSDLNAQYVQSRLGQQTYQPSTSMGALQTVHDIPTQHFYPQEGGLSISLHQNLDSSMPHPSIYANNINMQHMQQPRGAPIMMGMGPQSFSGYYHTNGMGVAPQGDLGYALQRPGVVPGTSVGAMQQMNQSMYLQQQQMQPSSMGSLDPHNSYSDLLTLSGSYMGMSAMSMPGSMPQDYMHNSASSYQMPYGDACSYNDQHQMNGNEQCPYHPYRGGSM